MSSKRAPLKRILSFIVFLIGCFLLIIIIHEDFVKDRRDLKRAQSQLVKSNLIKAEKTFEKLTTSWWVDSPARLGLILVKILESNRFTMDELPKKSKIKIKEFQLPVLLSQQFSKGNYHHCVELAKVGLFYGPKISRLFLSASLLELGKIKRANKEFSKVSKTFKSSDLGQRLIGRIKFLMPGINRMIMDRKGHLLGMINPEGEFELVDNKFKILIQNRFIQEIIKPSIYSGIRLSLDLELSRLAQHSLRDNRGSVVLLLIDTGEILAAVSDEVTHQEMGANSSPAFDQMLEPASISKLITTVAAYRAGLDPDQEISTMICTGAKRYNGGILYCASPKSKSDGLQQAMATSCNIAFAELGIKLGWKSLINEQKNFGFNNQNNYPIPLGRIIISQGNQRMLADLAIGLENTMINPVHTAMIAAVFGNQGKLRPPKLLWGQDGYLGYSPKAFPIPASESIIKKEWLAPIQHSMMAVTGIGGTAEMIAPFEFPVAMKTGTGGSYRDGFHINYIGYVPAIKPKYAFSVRITHKRRSYIARRSGYEVSRSLIFGLRNVFQNL